ncbi:lysozyme [Bosea sp. (in: a-proteobacteria)]|uniref:lysozyme n=1 Tax=Bosea sp. (in: a-proteobacteria) TaxID=1871050 RepID=UPI001AD407C4|nr:lysozyme [Bosea sp. (in: a-proteobacteria)]MBN9438260.1 lysozyme [Bosea sp. (in: a-proteobacteria)]
MTRRINAEGLKLIKQWEGLKLSAYKDVAGVWTIGYGSTGSHVTPGLEIGREEADRLLIKDLDRFERAVDKLVKVPLSANQFAALVSFAFNVGEGKGGFATSTLLKKLNAGNYDAVPSELGKWVMAYNPALKKKVRVPGLVNRRAAEAGLWAKGSFVSSNTVEAKPAAPPVVSVENAIKVATPLTGLFQSFTSGPAQIILAVAFVAGAAFLLWRWHRRQQEAAT